MPPESWASRSASQASAEGRALSQHNFARPMAHMAHAMLADIIRRIVHITFWRVWMFVVA